MGGAADDREPLARAALASLPFALLLCLFVAVMTAFPEVATWLPKTMKP